MKEIFLPFIVMAVLVPILFSPIMVDGYEISQTNQTVLVDFDYPVNFLKGLKSEIDVLLNQFSFVPFAYADTIDEDGFQTVRFVVTFENSDTLQEVSDHYVNTIQPLQQNIIENQMQNKMDNFSMIQKNPEEVTTLIGFNSETGKNIYQMYPKTVFFGQLTTGQTPESFELSFNNFLDAMKNMFLARLNQIQSTDETYTIHYTYGEVDG